MDERVMLLLVGGRSATPAIMGALQFIKEVDRVKFLLCQHKDNLYQTFQKNIIRLLKAAQPELVCDNEQDIQVADGNNFDEVSAAVARLCGKDTALHFVNLTSAPQPMAFAVYNYVREKHPQALPFSVYTDDSRLVPLVPGIEPRPLTQKLSIEAYLTACDTAIRCNFDVENLSCTPEKAKEIVYYFIKNLDVTDRLLSIIRTADAEINTSRTIPVKRSSVRRQNIESEEFMGFLQQLQSHQLISRFAEEKERFTYRVETKYDLAFLYGDWLEYYVYLEAQKVGFDEVAVSLELQDSKGEIDVFCLHQANPLICECKTGHYSSRDLDPLEGKGVRLGGNYCPRMFITTAQKDDNDKEFAKFVRKAANRRVVVATRKDLPMIGELIKKEMRDPTYPRN